MKVMYAFLLLTITTSYWSSVKEVEAFSPVFRIQGTGLSLSSSFSTKVAYKTGSFSTVASNDTISLDAPSIPQVPRSVERRRSNKREKPRVNGIDPREVELAPQSDIEFSQHCNEDQDEEECMMPSFEEADSPFVNMLRSSASYITNHRDTVVVCHIPGELLDWSGFPDLMEDIGLMWLLGMKIVLVAGCRSQVEDRLLQTQPSEDEIQDQKSKNGMRITNEEMMRIVEEESGYVRFEIERQLHRCLKLQGAETSEPGALNGNVVSGTFFEAAPIGVVDGVDHRFSGYPSRAHSSKILSIVENNRNIALLTSCAIGRDGELYYVNSESVASYIAGDIGATKLIYCSNNDMMLRNKKTNTPIQNFRMQDATKILEHFNVQLNSKFFTPFLSKNKDNNNSLSPDERRMLLMIGRATLALQNGVQRAHIVSPSDGSLLTELFTAKEGSGTCIIQDDSNDKIHPDEQFLGDLERKMDLFNDIYPIHEFPQLDIGDEVHMKNGMQTSFLY